MKIFLSQTVDTTNMVEILIWLSYHYKLWIILCIQGETSSHLKSVVQWWFLSIGYALSAGSNNTIRIQQSKSKRPVQNEFVFLFFTNVENGWHGFRAKLTQKWVRPPWTQIRVNSDPGVFRVFIKSSITTELFTGI